MRRLNVDGTTSAIGKFTGKTEFKGSCGKSIYIGKPIIKKRWGLVEVSGSLDWVKSEFSQPLQ